MQVLIKNPDVFLLSSIRVMCSVASVAQSCLIFFLKTEYCIFLLTRFHSNTSSQGKKLNVSISGGERREERRGGRLHRKRAGKEGERRGEEGKGGGLSHGAHEGETKHSESDPQPVHSLMPWSFPTNAVTTPLQTTRVSALIHCSTLATSGGGLREPLLPAAARFPPFLFFFLRDREKVPRPWNYKLERDGEWESCPTEKYISLWAQGKELMLRDNTSDYGFICFNWLNWLFDCHVSCRLWGFAVVGGTCALSLGNCSRVWSDAKDWEMLNSRAVTGSNLDLCAFRLSRKSLNCRL